MITDLLTLASLVDGLLLPAVATGLLFLSKLTEGDAGKRAERRFLACLVLMTVVTLRTVALCHEIWLIHTASLALLVFGAIVLPKQDTSAVV